MENYTNNDMFKPLCEKPSNYIKVIGVGGGGGNAVNQTQLLGPLLAIWIIFLSRMDVITHTLTPDLTGLAFEG